MADREPGAGDLITEGAGDFSEGAGVLASGRKESFSGVACSDRVEKSGGSSPMRCPANGCGRERDFDRFRDFVRIGATRWARDRRIDGVSDDVDCERVGAGASDCGSEDVLGFPWNVRIDCALDGVLERPRSLKPSSRDESLREGRLLIVGIYAG